MINMYKIGLVGYGHVGKAMHNIFGDWIKAIYDPYVEKPSNVESFNKKDAFNQVDLAIINVMTPENKDGDCNISIVDESVDWLVKTGCPLILVKSTVIPGTIDSLKQKHNFSHIVFSPEYFGESKYFMPKEWSDPKAWPFHIFGGDEKDTAKCVEFFKPIFNPRTFYYQIDAKTAELIKYAENAWGATKVIWANEFFDICKALGVNFDKMREGWALDPRVEKMHTSVYEKNRGFGGKCFPKDIKAIIKKSQQAGYDPKFLKEVWNSNVRFRKEGKIIE